MELNIQKINDMTHEEAINEIKSWDFLNEKEIEVIQTLIPELRESENERINKAIFKALSKKDARDVLLAEGVQVSEALAYLEKQKKQKPNYCHHEVDETGWTEEYRKAYYDGWNNCNMQHEQLKADQKPVEWSEKDKIIIEGACNALETYGHTKLASMLKSLRPQSKRELSKKDKKILQSLHHVMNCADAQNSVKRDGLSVADVSNFLFSIEPYWIPNKEQMEALMSGLRILPPGETYHILLSLYNDLKKLWYESTR